MPNISVVIPLYNKVETIQSTLESVLKQTIPPYEIVVIDDGSTDESVQIIRHLNIPKLSLVQQKNKGAAAARNAGIKQAKGDFIAFLDADDYWHPNHLEVIRSLIETYPEQSVFATALEVENKVRIFPSHYSIENFEPHKIYCLNYFTASLQTSVLSSSNTVIKKEICERIGLFNPNYISGQDTDFWIRIGLRYSIIFSSTICVRYNFEPGSLSNRSKNLQTKPSYEQYLEIEKVNLPLKIFLDNNRFSLAILAKLDGDKKGFKKMYEQIDLKNMNFKKRLLLKMPQVVLQAALKFQHFLMGFNIYLTAFK